MEVLSFKEIDIRIAAKVYRGAGTTICTWKSKDWKMLLLKLRNAGNEAIMIT